ncbi:unnamed protein product [Ilex paraguariensis]|uniref:Tyrosinase copper-binding domain-containing protein n=1 Tax=Ilex paraguariensis TaxID=185542 RepID=A0ABC8S3Q2_9AQUA
MASLPLTTATTTTVAYSSSSSTIILSSPLSSWPSFVKPGQCLTTRKRNHRFQVSCKNMHGGDQNPKAGSNNDGETFQGKFDRRNVLLGLGGLYGAANLIYDPSAFAAPVPGPDLTTCHNAIKSTNTGEPVACCPPQVGQEMIPLPYDLPTFTKLRTRRPAHEALVDPDYLKKFRRGIELMKGLPADHPHNFMQQANIHCAYCNGAYYQAGFKDVGLQVHFSWLFFPFHRWYLYFFERILIKLLQEDGSDNDGTFALPFWNWDVPDGMRFPPNMHSGSLYDPLRDSKHISSIIDLGYSGEDVDKPDDQQIQCNLSIMHTQMVNNSSRPLLFLGGRYYAGDTSTPGQGSIESTPHNQVHTWVGARDQPYHEDLGNFYSAGRDPVFYMHHANVDRLWTIRNTNKFMERDWLNALFVFYDEDLKLVSVKVRDCRDTTKLGYFYEEVPRPWEHLKRVRRGKKSNIAATVDPSKLSTFPILLTGSSTFLINRPKKSRTPSEKEEQEEVLVIGPIEFDSGAYVAFEVYVNEEDDVVKSDTCDAEYAGTFASLPHKHDSTKKSRPKISYLRIGLNKILEDLKAEDDDAVLITLKPQSTGKGVCVQDAKIEYMN